MRVHIVCCFYANNDNDSSGDDTDDDRMMVEEQQQQQQYRPNNNDEERRLLLPDKRRRRRWETETVDPRITTSAVFDCSTLQRSLKRVRWTKPTRTMGELRLEKDLRHAVVCHSPDNNSNNNNNSYYCWTTVQEDDASSPQQQQQACWLVQQQPWLHQIHCIKGEARVATTCSSVQWRQKRTGMG